MIEQILGWFSGDPASEITGRSRDELQLALSALLVEVAHSDDRFDEKERAVVARLLERRFSLPPAQARALLEAAERTADRSAELFHFTRIINERLSVEERIELIEMLWEVTYADGVLDKFEDALLRRIGGLIYVPDRERGLARQRVLKRLGLDDTL
ncbi:MAG: TerB family tellurite resistance protein [Alphaproteobacteria bacterium]|nr:TerB family tellurite resistance protein [Alphaproteobacteria bacterium]